MRDEIKIKKKVNPRSLLVPLLFTSCSLMMYKSPDLYIFFMLSALKKKSNKNQTEYQSTEERKSEYVRFCVK